jgi:predicted S18 family serine protease
MAQTAVKQAIYRVSRSLGMSTDSWTISLSVPYQDVTIYGDSLSAMVGLSVAALARGVMVAPDRVVTGTVTPEGHIGAVGSVPLKVAAAGAAHMRIVLVPEEQDIGDSDWQTPFLTQVSPVGSVVQAYEALTSSGSFQ